MSTTGRARRVRIYVSQDHRVAGSPIDAAILKLLRAENAQGATVLRGVEGFGATGRIHTGRIADVIPSLPLVIEWIDTPEKVDRLMPRVLQLVKHGLVTVDETEVVFSQPLPVRDLTPTFTVADVMSREVLSVAPTTPVREVVELTLRKAYRAVPVVEGGRPVGIITNTDLVERGGLGVRLDLLKTLDQPSAHALLERLSQQNLTAADVMTRDPVVVVDTATLPAAAELMARRRLKRLPVVDAAGVLVGMVSRVDLLRTVSGGFLRSAPIPRELGLTGDQPLSTIMRRDVPMVHPETPLVEVFQAVVSTRLNRALVVDHDGKVVGLVTDAELLDRVTPALRPSALRSLMRRLPFARGQGDEQADHTRGKTAAEVMSRSVAVVREDAPVSEAIATMLRDEHKLVAVTNAEGTLVGLVDRADLLHAIIPDGP